jgi:DNA polymerase I-like protein with 3'-5' exonuclease and polymerase domains
VTCRDCHGTGIITLYDKLLPFNPHSTQQVADLIRYYKLKMPKKRGEDRETTESKYLRRFGDKHDRKGNLLYPIFRTILECRQRQKLLSTYIWPLDANDRVHTVFGFVPSTWRKSSRNVNLQNIPKRSSLAHAFRKTLVASPGCVLIEADAAAIEAVLVGYAAGDPDYVRLAKLGVHDFVTLRWKGESVDLSLPDAQLRPLLKSVKKRYPEERERAKRGVHGSNYKLTAYGLHDEYEEEFPTERSAQDFQDFYFGLVPKVVEWQNSTMERAHRESFLDNHYQYRHYFYDVFTFNWRSQRWVLGDDAKRSVAFVPQADASAIQTEDLLALAYEDEQVLDPQAVKLIRGWLRLIIHDSFVIEVPKGEETWVAEAVLKVMTRPRDELAGLTIGAEVSIGENLAELSVWQPKQLA